MTDHNIELGVDTTEGVPGTEDAPAVDVAGRKVVRVIAGPNSPYSRYLNDCIQRRSRGTSRSLHYKRPPMRTRWRRALKPKRG